jgi:hypothetical protein
MNEGWVYGYGMTRKLTFFSLGKNTMVLQAAVSTFKACAVENTCNAYKNRNIYVPSHSQAMSKALDNYQINSKWSGTALNPL